MRLIDADALKAKLQESHDFLIEAWGGFTNMPREDKVRADEQIMCIARIVNAPTVDVVSEWIPCSERLPKEYEVLCCDIYKNCIVGHPFADDSANTGFCAESESEFMYECVAWMPLPEPWKGK